MGGKHWQFVTKNDKLKIPRKDSLFLLALLSVVYKGFFCSVLRTISNSKLEKLFEYSSKGIEFKRISSNIVNFHCLAMKYPELATLMIFLLVFLALTFFV